METPHGTPTTGTPQGGSLFSFALLTSLFFAWGFLTCMNDILIPYLKNAFELSLFQATLVQLAFFLAYAIGSALYYLISASSGPMICAWAAPAGTVVPSNLGVNGCYNSILGDGTKRVGVLLKDALVTSSGATTPLNVVLQSGKACQPDCKHGTGWTIQTLFVR